MNNLDQKLRDYYQSQSLPDAKIDEILSTGKIVRPAFWNQTRWIAAVAIIVLLIGAGAITFHQTQPSLENMIAAEVLKNHAKQLAPEINSSDFNEIQSALPKLEFSIAPTQPDLLAGLRVQGGRYCSIQEELAAQISLLDNEGKSCTLYIAPLTETLLAAEPGIYEQKDGKVQIWHDTHRLFAVVR
ncbi:hypothetical protein [Rubellicoccus peritrichatus]|uniref:DUF3379 domain-containing protein n=1 Tax=Rubellicoccus peritrichatus TaxID=3080537 RepID=A0AAQ3L9X5_9BACT|nr:hypothetical protein [Puniceicoccus sp. CR14]WOO41382.1 hypothetical protein RZN69_22410 [Puniceicoccus sp. CR14]